MISTKTFLLSASLAIFCILSTTAAAPAIRPPTSQSKVDRKCVENGVNLANLQSGYTCDRFINCSGGSGTEQDCPNGLVFHQPLQECVDKGTAGACKDDD
ncbi:hypothetical protein BG015_001639 [Linnemannia schmuckeri]|uniref:Chitin-binding type-2 domain-containing protein n=1 Tax=Linnemannia schmuckeri TaxID=64567 RepID=A0A9P5S3T4_9FUNG|nr:hypothetical protein BG015_001639 [Linnemannia schmuckeri]